jgi:hypothetical protein
MLRKCIKCNNSFPKEQFVHQKRGHICIVCEKHRRETYSRIYNLKNGIKIKQYDQERYIKDKEKQHDRYLRSRRENILAWMIRSIKARAKRLKIPFNLIESDLHIPEKCPVLGITLKRGIGKQCDASPSVDRIVPSLGYIKNNIRIISWRANALKHNASVEELEQVLKYLKGELE